MLAVIVVLAAIIALIFLAYVKQQKAEELAEAKVDHERRMSERRDTERAMVTQNSQPGAVDNKQVVQD